uniref:uncharacterized protein LOC117611238 n=1 Tax=Osmia lignaria TaxID=473952 RepID=UPI001478F7DA|nr:uncharacterized protein LOC117611238 [Osmia lignaria]
MVNPNEFKVVQLKDALQKMGLPTTGTKTELLNRLQEADPEGAWMQNLNMLPSEDATQQNAPQEAAPPTVENREGDRLAYDYQFLLRERELMERELRIMQRENEPLRNPSRSSNSTTDSRIGIKAVSDVLSDFDGVNELFSN